LFIFSGNDKVTDFDEFEQAGLLQVVNSENGLMTCDVFDHWALIFVAWLDDYRSRLAPQNQTQTAILFIDSCRAHCSLYALHVLSEHNCKVLSFPPHLTHVLQPIDVSCAKAFKGRIVTNMEQLKAHPEHLPATSTTEESRYRAIVVLAALSSLGECSLYVCMEGYARCGLYPWSAEKALQSQFVHISDVDPEVVDRERRTGVFHCGSSVMTDEAFLLGLEEWIARRNANQEAAA
jgi:hypothetical protein